ncbi:hypothetical protein OCAE111667_15725 [Occultella aeris]|uniref:Uncharacterized protein n=1 Tax=Occultella aeris TaxID=2761496 RepID=A0A7M4DMT5_9MICO|nr:hypothetical protein HALOF300_03462 [Occultella aeris]
MVEELDAEVIGGAGMVGEEEGGEAVEGVISSSLRWRAPPHKYPLQSAILTAW